MMLLAAAGYNWAFDLSIWSLVVFVILVSIIAACVSKPLSVAMRARQASILASLRQAEIAIEEARKLREEHDRALVRSEEAAKELVTEAGRDAIRAKELILARAASEIERAKARSQREIMLAKNRAIHEIWQAYMELSGQVAEKVVRSQLSANDHRRLVDDAMNDLRSIPRVSA